MKEEINFEVNKDNCTNCKFLKWEEEEKEKKISEFVYNSFCSKHDKQIDEMFNEELDLDEIGCLQFEPKEKNKK